jgi:hypothetical protein
MFRLHHLSAALCSGVLWLVGCSAWNAPTNSGTRWLLPPKLAADSVMLEVALLDVPRKESQNLEALWKEVDEQPLAPAIRRRLTGHGLRCGLVATQLPDWIRHQLEAQEKTVSLEQKDGAAVLRDVPTQRRIQCRAGQSKFILLRQGADLRVPGDTEDDPWKTYRDAECGFALRATRQDDGRVRIELTGQIRHGAQRQRWLGEQGLFRIDAARDFRTFDETRVEAALSSGQTLLLTATPEPGSLGRVFFGDNGLAGVASQILFVRLVHSQYEDVFTPPSSSTPIVTPGQ